MVYDYIGKVIILTEDNKVYDMKALKTIGMTPNPAIVDYNELMNYAKKLHNSREEYERLINEIEGMKEQLEVAKAIKTLKEFIEE